MCARTGCSFWLLLERRLVRPDGGDVYDPILPTASLFLAQVLEAVGPVNETVDRCFTDTTSRLRGTDFPSLYMDVCRLYQTRLNNLDSSILPYFQVS